MVKKIDKASYDADAVKVLGDIEHIRLRPAMYVGDADEGGYYHILKEIVDNSLDEALAGHADTVSVTLDDDRKGATVSDNGRGIPLDKNKRTGKSTLTTVFMFARAGGKFNHKAYSTSAGLHGVGSTATNALSEEFEAWSHRDGKVGYVKFNLGKLPKGVMDAEIKPAKGKQKSTGTIVHFRPDPGIFKTMSKGYDPRRLRARFEEVSFLAPGVTIDFAEKAGGKTHSYSSKDGLAGLIAARKQKKETFEVESFSASIDVEVEAEEDGKTKKKTARVDVAVGWTNTEAQPDWFSYVNLTPTDEGGSHQQGLEKTIGGVLLERAKNKCSTAELFKGMKAAVHIKHPDPKFKSQTKNKLMNKDVDAAIVEALTPLFTKWVRRNKEWVDAFIAECIELYNERQMTKENREAMRGLKKVSKGARGLLPGKLAEAPRCAPEDRELFIVEGDSAGGSCITARDATYQEVLALRGKVLNSARVDLAKTLENKELADIVTAVGAGVGAGVDVKKARVGKVLLLADADPDGKHITALLLSFAMQYLRPLVDAGMLYVVNSPLYQCSVPSTRKRYYAHSMKELKAKAGSDYRPENVSRLKGHGEADAAAVGDYAMNPNTRKLWKVTAGKDSNEVVLKLMADDVNARKELLGIAA